VEASQNEGRGEVRSAPTEAVELTEESVVELWHDTCQKPWATFAVNGHLENRQVRSEAFRLHVSRTYYRRRRAALSEQAISSAINALAAKAMFDGPEHKVYHRQAWLDGNVYIDFGNEQWQVIEIRPASAECKPCWRILESHEVPVKFRRSPGMKPLPTPVAPEDACPELLFDFINVKEEDRPLVLGFLIGAPWPEPPYPPLVVHGSQGSAKSTVSWQFADLIDPHEEPLIGMPKESRDLAVAAENRRMIAIDNVSSLSQEKSDALCRLASGAGFSVRRLYTDAEEVTLSGGRPLILNGINPVASSPDLADRAIFLELPPLREYKPDRLLREEFEKAKPAIFTGMLNAVSIALARVQQAEEQLMKSDRLPRMADFVVWATAAEPALGLADGEFLQAYL
jgi:hypothetical protein